MAMRALLKRNTYYDLITLMSVAQAVKDLPGVEDVGVVMATELNRELLHNSNLLPVAFLAKQETTPGPEDLLIVVRAMGGMELKTIIAQALLMGDECHNRNKAATSLFLREVAPYLVETGTSTEETASVLRFIHGNDHFFVNLSMATCKAATLASHGIPFSSVVTTLARNGTDFGIRVSGLGNSWYIAPAQPVKGLYFTDDRTPVEQLIDQIILDAVANQGSKEKKP